MVFLIFTRSNLYLGINGRITELLPFGEKPYLSLGEYTFPDDLEKVLHIIHQEVEAYFDRTAFGMPSNIEVLVVYSEDVNQAIKLEIHNEFNQILPAGWIWRNGFLNRTDHLDSEAEDQLSISFRRLIKSLKTDLSIKKPVAWNMGNSVNVQILEQITFAPPKTSAIEVFKDAIPALPPMPLMPSMPSLKISAIIPIGLKRINLMALLVSMRRNLARIISVMPSLPGAPVLPDRKYLISIPAVIIVIALGALVWPDGDSNQPLITKDQDLITNTSKAPLNPSSQQMVNSDTTTLYSSKFTPLDSKLVVDLDSKGQTARSIEEGASNIARKQSEGNDILIASIGPTEVIGLGENETNRSAEQSGSIPMVGDINNTNSNTIASNDPKSNGSIGVKASNSESSEDNSSSSLSLSDYAHHTRAASFPGGEGGIIRYIAMNARYPKLAKRKKITGTVVVKFDVDIEGRITNPTIVKSVGYGCDKEAIRVVSNMPLWKPATQMRKRISSSHTISVPFN